MRVVGVADASPQSVGALLTQGSGVFFTIDAMELAAMGADADLLIEVSGDPELKPRTKQAHQEQVDTFHSHDNGAGWLDQAEPSRTRPKGKGT